MDHNQTLALNKLRQTTEVLTFKAWYKHSDWNYETEPDHTNLHSAISPPFHQTWGKPCMYLTLGMWGIQLPHVWSSQPCYYKGTFYCLSQTKFLSQVCKCPVHQHTRWRKHVRSERVQTCPPSKFPSLKRITRVSAKTLQSYQEHQCTT